jgi:glycosyltransferase involved in cell wall biosynthesis
MASVSISAIVITYNEEKNIGRCLGSLSGVADEIIIVDSYSTDRTKEICTGYNVKFLEHKFDGYSEQKNWSIKQATFPVILSLDADEELSAELKQSIIEVKKNWDCDGYLCNRLNNYCGKWIRFGSWYPDRKLRLWNKDKGHWAILKIHEKVEMEPLANTGRLKGDLLHYSYYSVNQHIRTTRKYSLLSAIEYNLRNKKSNIFLITFKPVWKFLRDYIFKAGFLNGYYGIIIASIDSYGVFLKYRELYQIQRKTI